MKLLKLYLCLWHDQFYIRKIPLCHHLGQWLLIRVFLNCLNTFKSSVLQFSNMFAGNFTSPSLLNPPPLIYHFFTLNKTHFQKDFLQFKNA